MGNQLRMNHAGALAEGGDADFPSVDFQAREGSLLNSVGGKDGLSRLLKIVELRA